MNTISVIKEMESELNKLKHQNATERFEYIKQFNTKINLLISKTPTGELRNELSELNILYHAILETII